MFEASVLCGWLPRCKRRFDVLAAGRVQSCVRPVDAAFSRPLALMVSANQVPLCFAGFDSLRH